MNRRVFLVTVATGVTAVATAEVEAEEARYVLSELEAATAVNNVRGTCIRTDVSELLRSVKDADFVVIN